MVPMPKTEAEARGYKAEPKFWSRGGGQFVLEGLTFLVCPSWSRLEDT